MMIIFAAFLSFVCGTIVTCPLGPWSQSTACVLGHSDQIVRLEYVCTPSTPGAASWQWMGYVTSKMKKIDPCCGDRVLGGSRVHARMLNPDSAVASPPFRFLRSRNTSWHARHLQRHASFTLPPENADPLRTRGLETPQWQPHAAATPRPLSGFRVGGPRRPKRPALVPPLAPLGAAPWSPLGWPARCPPPRGVSPHALRPPGLRDPRLRAAHPRPPPDALTALPPQRVLPWPLTLVVGELGALLSTLRRALFYLEAAWLRTFSMRCGHVARPGLTPWRSPPPVPAAVLLQKNPKKC